MATERRSRPQPDATPTETENARQEAAQGTCREAAGADVPLDATEDGGELRSSARWVDAEVRRLRRWLREAPEGAAVELSRQEVENLLADVERRDQLLEEYEANIGRALQAHAEGGPDALAQELELQPFDRRQKMTAEAAADVLTDYWYSVARNGFSARAAAERVCVEYDVWPNLEAFRAWLKRQREELRDPDSPLRRTPNGAILDAENLPLPDLR